MLAYVGKKADGSYAPFHLEQLAALPGRRDLRRRLPHPARARGGIQGRQDQPDTGRLLADYGRTRPTVSVLTLRSSSVSLETEGKPPGPAGIPRLVWSGDVPHQKWMNFYTKVLSKFASTAGLKLTLRVEVAPAEGVSPQKVEETKMALRELGLKDSLEGGVKRT